MDLSVEYNSLRNESLDLQKREVNIISFCLTITLAILGFSFTTDNYQSYLFNLPLPILIFGLIQLRHINSAQMLITTYISKKIEKNVESLNWETAIKTFRLKFKERKRMLRGKKSPKIATISAELYAFLISILGLICNALSIIYSINKWEYIISIVFTILWIVISMILVRNIIKTFNNTNLTIVNDIWDKI